MRVVRFISFAYRRVTSVDRIMLLNTRANFSGSRPSTCREKPPCLSLVGVVSMRKTYFVAFRSQYVAFLKCMKMLLLRSNMLLLYHNMWLRFSW